MFDSDLCLNCQSPLTGPFCSQCGQKDQHRIVPMRHLLRDLFHEVVSVDHHVVKTFWTLLSRPGQLTVEYLEGRRMRHLPPLRLYLLTSFLMFLTLSALTPRWLKINQGSTPSAVATPEPGSRQHVSEGKTQSGFERRMELGAKKVQDNPSAFMAQVISVLPKVMFILLPLFALLMKVLYLRRHILYAAHVIFALHVHTALYLMFLAAMALGFIPGLAGWVGLAIVFGPPLYLAFALHRTYGQSWLKTLAKEMFLSFLYLPLVLTGAIGAILWTLYQAA